MSISSGEYSMVETCLRLAERARQSGNDEMWAAHIYNAGQYAQEAVQCSRGVHSAKCRHNHTIIATMGDAFARAEHAAAS